jgi:UDP-glucose 4-epimerase
MIILVGGGGFLGSHVRRLLAGGMAPEVVVVTDSDPTLPLGPNETRIGREAFAGDAGLALIRRADAIIYLATASTVATFLGSPWDELAHNVDPLMRLLHRICQSGSSCRFTFVSSGGTVYGRTNSSKPIPETWPLQPISPYGMGKVMQEQALAFFGRTGQLDYTVLRLANPVGVFGRSHSQGLVTAALRAVATKAALTLFGDGSHVRDIFDADDAAEAIMKAAITRTHSGATWNVGSGKGYSNLEVIHMVERVTGQHVRLDRQPARDADVPFIVLDSARIGSDLGWAAKRDLQDTIDEIWRHNFARDRRSYCSEARKKWGL